MLHAFVIGDCVCFSAVRSLAAHGAQALGDVERLTADMANGRTGVFYAARIGTENWSARVEIDNLTPERLLRYDETARASFERSWRRVASRG